MRLGTISHKHFDYTELHNLMFLIEKQLDGDEAHVSAAVFSKERKLLVRSRGYREADEMVSPYGVMRKKQKIRAAPFPARSEAP